jgi:hypothetical protein
MLLFRWDTAVGKILYYSDSNNIHYFDSAVVISFIGKFIHQAIHNPESDRNRSFGNRWLQIMPSVLVPTDVAMHVVRPAGERINMSNQSGVDVYYDEEAGRLNASQPGTIPNGSKLAANGGTVTIWKFPCGGLWVRAAAQTTIEVEP